MDNFTHIFGLQVFAFYFIFRKNGNFDDIIIKINPALSAHEALNKIIAICKKYSPSVPFAYKFVDGDYAKKFDNEERIGKLASVFAVLAISFPVLVCLVWHRSWRNNAKKKLV